MSKETPIPQKHFVFERRVFLKDTNLEGNVYFSHYFEWQGEAREDFFRQNVAEHMQILQSGARLITVNAWMTFKRSTYLFDEILIDVKTTNLKQMTLELVFTFIHKATGDVIAKGGQKLAFADSAGTFIPVPEPISKNARYFLIESLDTESTDLHERMRHTKVTN